MSPKTHTFLKLFMFSIKKSVVVLFNPWIGFQECLLNRPTKIFYCYYFFIPTVVSSHSDSYSLQANLSSCLIEYKIDFLVNKHTARSGFKVDKM